MEESQHHYYDYMLYLMREYGAEFITFLVLLTNTMLVMIRDRTRKHNTGVCLHAPITLGDRSGDRGSPGQGEKLYINYAIHVP